MDLKYQIKDFCNEKNMTFKELADKADLAYNGLHDKFRRDSLTVKDLKRLLDALDKEMIFIDKQNPRS